MGNRHAVELEARFFRNFAELAIQLAQRLGLLMHETDRIDDDPSSFDLPNYGCDLGSRPFDATVRMVLISERVAADAELASHHTTHLLDVCHVPWPLVQVLERCTVGRKDERSVGGVEVDSLPLHVVENGVSAESLIRRVPMPARNLTERHLP